MESVVEDDRNTRENEYFFDGGKKQERKGNPLKSLNNFILSFDMIEKNHKFKKFGNKRKRASLGRLEDLVHELGVVASLLLALEPLPLLLLRLGDLPLLYKLFNPKKKY